VSRQTTRVRSYLCLATRAVSRFFILFFKTTSCEAPWARRNGETLQDNDDTHTAMTEQKAIILEGPDARWERTAVGI
jgi:hypothetical protein